MMSDFNLVVVDPLTGPLTPVVVLPVVPIGPFVPGASAALTIPIEVRASAKVIEKIEKTNRVRRSDSWRLKAISPPLPAHPRVSMVRGWAIRCALTSWEKQLLWVG